MKKKPMKKAIVKKTVKKALAKSRTKPIINDQSNILQGKYSQTGYKASRTANKEGRTPTNATGSQHQLYDRERLVAQSREFMRDNSIYNGMIERAVSYIMGNGYTLQAKTKSESWNRRIEAQFKQFWKNPDIKDIMCGSEFENMVCKELLVAGDVGIIKTNELKLQMIEAEQITSSKYKDGIKKNQFGKPLTYYIEGYSDHGYLNNNASPKSPDDFIFVSDPDRPSSIRSVPPCQSAFPNLHRINDILDAEAIAWQLVSRMALSINRKDAAAKALDISGLDDDADSTGNNADISDRITETPYGIIFHGEVDEEIKGIDRNLPGKDFPTSIKMFLRLLGLPLGLPIEITMLDWSESNYSQSRAVLEQAYVNFRRRQLLIENKFHRNMYEWFVENQVASGMIADRKDKFIHNWIKPTFPWIDQLKEAQAWGSKLDRSLTLQGTAIKSLGDDPDMVLEGREIEIRRAIDRANNIKKDTGQEVPWELFAGVKINNNNAGKPSGVLAEPKDINNKGGDHE